MRFNMYTLEWLDAIKSEKCSLVGTTSTGLDVHSIYGILPTIQAELSI